MTPHLLSLSDHQLNVVLQGAEQVPYEWRGRFLHAIVDQLLREDVVGDDDVQAAIGVVLERMTGRAA